MHDKQEVVVTGINMPFGSMVAVMFKWTAACVPALLALALFAFFASATIAGVVEAFMRVH